MNIKITSDSTCDLPKHLLEQYNITTFPLTIIKDGENFKDNVTITPADIFAHVAAGGSLCSTAACNIAIYQDVFAKYSEAYDGVLHINIGSGFSSCHQNARLAAKLTGYKIDIKSTTGAESVEDEDVVYDEE